MTFCYSISSPQGRFFILQNLTPCAQKRAIYRSRLGKRGGMPSPRRRPVRARHRNLERLDPEKCRWMTLDFGEVFAHLFALSRIERAYGPLWKSANRAGKPKPFSDIFSHSALFRPLVRPLEIQKPLCGRGLRCFGAGEGNRTLVCSLGSCRSTIELHPQNAGGRERTRPASRLSRFTSPLSSASCGKSAPLALPYPATSPDLPRV